MVPTLSLSHRATLFLILGELFYSYTVNPYCLPVGRRSLHSDSLKILLNLLWIGEICFRLLIEAIQIVCDENSTSRRC